MSIHELNKDGNKYHALTIPFYIVVTAGAHISLLFIIVAKELLKCIQMSGLQYVVTLSLILKL